MCKLLDMTDIVCYLINLSDFSTAKKDKLSVFMARRAIPTIAFPRILCMFIYLYILVSLARVCVVYVVKEVASFRGAWSINGSGT